LEVSLVLPSLNVLEAALAAFAEVFSELDFLWVRALPAADFDAFPVDGFARVFAALDAAALPVCLLAIDLLPLH
jgi:hypothetical protein